jgi:hypothetical protein
MINYKKNNNNKIIFASYISRVIEYNKQLVILIYPETEADNEVTSRNVFAYDELGNHLWTIEEAPPVENFSSPYTHVFIADEDYMKRHYDDKTTERKLIAYNVHGYDYEVDIKTGKIKLVKGQSRAW